MRLIQIAGRSAKSLAFGLGVGLIGALAIPSILPTRAARVQTGSTAKAGREIRWKTRRSFFHGIPGQEQAGDDQGRERTVQDRSRLERHLRGPANDRGLDQAEGLGHAAAGRAGHRAWQARQERRHPRRVRPRQDRQVDRGHGGRKHDQRAGTQAGRRRAAAPGEGACPSTWPPPRGPRLRPTRT